MAKEELDRIERTTQITQHTMNLMSLAPLDLMLCTGKELEDRCVLYFNQCYENEMRPTVAGFALAIGISRPTLLAYIRGETKCPLDVKQTLNRFYSALNAMIEDYMMTGAINPVSGIFLMKNNFQDYQDKQDFVINNKQETVVSEDKLLEEANLLNTQNPKLANFEE